MLFLHEQVGPERDLETLFDSPHQGGGDDRRISFVCLIQGVVRSTGADLQRRISQQREDLLLSFDAVDVAIQHEVQLVSRILHAFERGSTFGGHSGGHCSVVDPGKGMS
ncbi:hypothetical protein CPBF1521_43540 [Xanthomonas arboricola pv. juglandis]|nr:hypothetical protein CPBF1521_43540 [Xanthomonas arboricola pv. juglandis]SYZ61503.1 hypothetical protein CPBF427_36910 [Xanthomonas arboricola pv. juglandis]